MSTSLPLDMYCCTTQPSVCTNRRGTYITDSCSTIASHFKERVTRCLQINEKGSEIVFQCYSH